jgi:hypothetical protein
MIYLDLYNPLIIPVSIKCVSMPVDVNSKGNLPFHSVIDGDAGPAQQLHRDESLFDVSVS